VNTIHISVDRTSSNDFNICLFQAETTSAYFTLTVGISRRTLTSNLNVTNTNSVNDIKKSVTFDQSADFLNSSKNFAVNNTRNICVTNDTCPHNCTMTLPSGLVTWEERSCLSACDPECSFTIHVPEARSFVLDLEHVSLWYLPPDRYPLAPNIILNAGMTTFKGAGSVDETRDVRRYDVDTWKVSYSCNILKQFHVQF
jgi:hypothetical protein